MTDLVVRPAADADRPVMARLWMLFRHDMSEFRGTLPNPDGTFRRERLDSAFTETGWAPYLLMSGDRPVGFAIVRALDRPIRVLNSYFVVRGARRTGIGLLGAKAVVSRHPGKWEVAFQDDNQIAVKFWRRVAAEIAGEAWEETRRPVPGMPEVPPDVWISFQVAG
jgi:predicted acetyltransferase